MYICNICNIYVSVMSVSYVLHTPCSDPGEVKCNFGIFRRKLESLRPDSLLDPRNQIKYINVFNKAAQYISNLLHCDINMRERLTELQ